jgi:xanthine/uracil/vitamin C permease (AzgA family)
VLKYNVPWRTALSAIWIAGFVFAALSLLGVRTWMVRCMPSCIRLAMACGIGLFLAFIGLKVRSHPKTHTCPSPQACYRPAQSKTSRDRAAPALPPPDMCSSFSLARLRWANESQDMGLIVNDGATFVTLNTPLSDNNPDFQKIWLGVVVLFIMGVLLSRNFPGAILVGILFGTFTCWIDGACCVGS